MPKIINAYAEDNPLVSALTGFAGTFGSNTAQTEVYRQKAKGLMRENENIPLLADAITRGDYIAAARAGVMADREPKNVAGYGQYVGVNKYGPSSNEALTATMAVPGANYGNTVQGTNAEMANKRGIAQMTTDRALAHDQRKFDNTPVSALVNGIPTMISQSEALRTRAQPVLSLTQAQGGVLQNDMPTLSPDQRAAAGGYTPKLPGNLWVGATADGRMAPTADGRTSVQDGQPIVGPVTKLEGPSTEGISGVNGIDKDLLNSRIATDQTKALIDRVHAGLQQPDAAAAIGWVGQGATVFNNVRAQFDAISRLAGGTSSQAEFAQPGLTAAIGQATNAVFANPQWNARAQQLGIDSGKMRSQIQDLAYAIAKAQDPSGRVSVDDVRRATETVGASLMDPTAASAVLLDLRDRVEMNQGIRETATRRMYPKVGAPPTGQSTGGQMPQPGAPTRIRIDANGNLIQ